MAIRSLISLFSFCCILLISACSSTTSSNKNDYPDVNDNSPAGKIINSRLNHFYQEWKGVRYRLGGQSKSGIDCSAFVKHAFAEQFNLQLPRSTQEQKNVGIKIKKSQLKYGDLVFFRRNQHVGIYIGNGKFMHASTSKGVMISSLNEKYWSRNYTQARRVL